MMKNQDNQYYKLDKDANILYEPPGVDTAIDRNTRFSVKQQVKIRKEDFGAAIRVGYSEYFITEEILQLYYLICELKTFNVAELYEYVDNAEALSEVLTYLEDIDIICRM